MKKILILVIIATSCFAQEDKKQLNLDNISTKGLDKNVAKVFKETKQLILKSRKNKDESAELLGSKQWCYLLHNFDFLEQAKDCYFIIGMDAKSEANWPYLYGKAALQQGNIADAIIGFDQTLIRDINYLPAHYYLIQLAMQQGELLTAFEYHSKVPANLKLTANMLNLTGDLFTQVENFYVAIGYYQQALKLVPKADSLNYKIAQNYQNLDQIDLAKEFIIKSGKIGILLPDPYFQQVLDTTVGEIPYLIKAKTALNKQEFKKAIQFYEKALKFNPNSNSAKINIAVAYFQDNQIEKAFENFKQLNKESPENLKVIYNLAIIAKTQNKFNLAIDYLNQYRKYNVQDSAVNLELAKLYYQTKQYGEVIKIAAIKNEENMEEIQLLNAKSLIQTEQFSKAISLLTQIHQHKPQNQEVLLLLAKLYSQVPNRELRKAELSYQYAQMAFNIEPNQLSYWELLMALDEAEKCQEFEEISEKFAQLINTETQFILSEFSNQRGSDYRCKLE
jgi:tetratricopeptide (TPR) repeat protein